MIVTLDLPEEIIFDLVRKGGIKFMIINEEDKHVTKAPRIRKEPLFTKKDLPLKEAEEVISGLFKKGVSFVESQKVNLAIRKKLGWISKHTIYRIQEELGYRSFRDEEKELGDKVVNYWIKIG